MKNTKFIILCSCLGYVYNSMC